MVNKKISDSKVQIAQVMMPEHSNAAGNVHGGYILKLVDQASAIVAARHTHQNCVTASVDRMDFISPVYIGNLVFAMASINYTGKTSMEIGVRIEAECLKTGTHTHVGSAYLTFVALGENDKPVEISQIIPETDEEKRRYDEAKKRREIRLQQAKKHRHVQQPCIVRVENLK